MPDWIEIDLAYEPSNDRSQPFGPSERTFPAESLGRVNYPIDTERQRHFEAQLRRLAVHLGSPELPIFVSWRGQRLRMDQGCVGHAVAAGIIEVPEDNAQLGYVTHVRLVTKPSDGTMETLPFIGKPRRVWLKAFWGFDPPEEGYLGFTRAGDRNHFIEAHRPGDLVLIYGADSAETEREDRRQALGFLEIEPTPTSDKERSSAAGWAWKVDKGWVGRWSNAVPVRRAWRVERRIEVRHIAPQTYTPARARNIASRGELLTDDEAFLALQLPVTPVHVFGEQPIELVAPGEATMSNAFAPSRGLEPTFGGRESHYEDGANYLYMLAFDGDARSLLGRPVGSQVVVKVGYSNDPMRRCSDHNSTLPPAAKTRWRLWLKSRAFPSGNSAKAAEDTMKIRFAQRFESLGGEFFLGATSDLESAFVEAARPAAFVITASPRSQPRP